MGYFGWILANLYIPTTVVNEFWDDFIINFSDFNVLTFISDNVGDYKYIYNKL